ncbi:peptide ABC transporter substrate-binding protein [Carboxydothermus hydrogenoformans]|uniref:peptide ABC transporter substrate-binding protein n=1 Tax=Carboxydothermus hydrogenoformans TaxID=129958 RepID=UPI0003132A13|nr:peptide ABC transporter substrate-binding protein [Carboxydothermus hydrogenoformans]
MRKRNGLLALLAVVLSFSLVFTGCAKKTEENKTGEKPEQKLVLAVGDEGSTLDPNKMSDLYAADVVNQTFETLVKFDANGKIVPALAEKWEVSPDGTEYTFYLRDAKWSDGTPVTAKDVKFSWLRLLDPKTAAPYAYLLTDSAPIKGAKEFNSGKAKADAVGITVVNDKTIKVKLVSPSLNFLSIVTMPQLVPINEKTVKENPDFLVKDNLNIICNGPFMYKEYKPKEKVVLVKNPNYWDAKNVKLEQVEFNFVSDQQTATTLFEQGKLDLTVDLIPPALLEQYMSQGKAKEISGLNTNFAALNTKLAPLNNPKVRKALAMAIDREGLTKILPRQKAAYAFVPFGIKEPDGKDFREKGGSLIEYNVEEAKKLLAEAGYPDGKGFPELRYLTADRETSKKIAQYLQEQWRKNLNISTKLEVM